MALMLLGLVLFIGMHLMPVTGGKAALIERLGDKPYKAVFVLVSLAGIVVLVMGYNRADYVPVYTPPLWGRHLTMLLMLIGVVLVVAAYSPSRIKQMLGHPMLTGVALWGLGHLFVRGDLASLLLFGGIGGYAVLARILSIGRVSPVTAKLPSQGLRADLITVAIGIALYAALLVAHPWLFGVAVIA
ncbi:MAG: NnrU family protein [Geminicoccaceae bacterium]